MRTLIPSFIESLSFVLVGIITYGGNDIITGSEHVSEQVTSLPLFVGMFWCSKIGLVILSDRFKVKEPFCKAI